LATAPGGKTLRLTLLAPDIVEAILDGRQACAVALPALLEPLPSSWEEGPTLWKFAGCNSSTARSCWSIWHNAAPVRAY
jgi:hypothetical protein